MNTKDILIYFAYDILYWIVWLAFIFGIVWLSGNFHFLWLLAIAVLKSKTVSWEKEKKESDE